MLKTLKRTKNDTYEKKNEKIEILKRKEYNKEAEQIQILGNL